MANKFNFDKILKNMKSIDISLDLANTVKNEFMSNFKNQGFNGQKWKEVQRRIEGTPEYKYPKSKGTSRRTSAILVRSGKLRRDVSNSVSTGHKNNNLSYTLVVNNPYAEIHNEGTNKIPRRQFIGMTPELNKKLLTKISQKIGTIWE